MRGACLPDNWSPSIEDRHYGRCLQLGDEQIDGMAEDMRLWAGANANRQIARKSNWSMAFKGWMRREVAKRRNGNAATNPTMAAFDRLIAGTAGDEGEANPPMRDITP